MSPIPKSSKEIVKNCKSSLDELKAIDVCSFEVEEISSFTSFIMVASGTSGPVSYTHLRAHETR